MHRVAAIALGLLLVATAATTANAVECELYTTCADCTCSQFDYDLQSSCSSGCAWEVGAQRCVTAEAAQNSGVEAFYKLWKTDTQNPSTTLKEKLLEHGQTTCDIGAAPGTIVTVACFFTVATAFTLFMLCSYVRDKKKASVELDHTDWFLARVREHVPPSDTLLWSDAATKTNKKFSGGPYVALAMTMDVLLLVPSIVWLGIGLPYSIESNWEFGFYYPICFVGGFGLIGVLVSVIASCADSNAAVKRQAYALTDKHAIVLMANANKEEMDANSSVVSYAADTVSCVSLVGGKNVVFSVTSGAQGGNTAVHNTPQQRAALARAGVPTGLHSVTFADLPDPMAVFRLLQERSNGYDASTQPVVGVKVRRGSGSSAGRSEPPTGTPVTAGVAPRPVVSSSGFDGMEAPMLSTNTGGAHNDKGGRGYTTINM